MGFFFSQGKAQKLVFSYFIFALVYPSPLRELNLYSKSAQMLKPETAHDVESRDTPQCQKV